MTEIDSKAEIGQVVETNLEGDLIEVDLSIDKVLHYPW